VGKRELAFASRLRGDHPGQPPWVRHIGYAYRTCNIVERDSETETVFSKSRAALQKTRESGGAWEHQQRPWFLRCQERGSKKREKTETILSQATPGIQFTKWRLSSDKNFAHGGQRTKDRGGRFPP